ncbi:FG-GAP repeat domain-containing protein, partial [Enhygromyxa salina]
NDIIWYDPHNGEISSWRWTDQTFKFVAKGPSDTGSLGHDKGVEYMPIVGDFNGDALTDIFWYSAGDGADLMWWSQGDADGIFFAASSAQVAHDYRPFVGDFDANGIDDILWFAAYAETVHVTSKIWYFTEDETYTSRVLSTHRDYSPYVADFDDDGCSDILWYKPDDPNLESPLWRCLPNDLDFACEPPLTTPAGTYPVGFGGAY